MTRDPFEHMKNSNPVPPGNEPSAPMSMAERIVGGRRAGWPGWALTAATAIAVLVVGLGSVWLLGGNGGGDVAAGDTTTSSTPADSTSVPEITVAPPTTNPETTTTTVVAAPVGETVIYLLVDDPTASGVSPALVPVARPLAALSISPIDEPTAAVGFLLTGPTPGESSSTPTVSTAIPEGTRLLDLTIEGRIATVDLSGEFASGGVGSLAEEARIEQLVYTLTRFDDIDGIRLEIDGVPVELFGGHGIVLDDPAVRSDLDTLLPAIMIESPAYGGHQDYELAAGGMLFASGSANVFEATVSLALTDADGLILWEGFTTASCGTGCRGEWEIAIPYDVDEPQMGSLIAWESSARDGSQINVREHPVWLTPSADIDQPLCSAYPGAAAETAQIDQPELPAAVAATRKAIFDAVIACDWDALGALMGPGFTYSFGGGSDPIGFWQQLEEAGEEPMYYLRELLDRPYGTQPGPNGMEYFAWPSAFVAGWDEVSEADKQALAPLYGAEDLAAFEDFGGYFGYRVGILTDGTWVYFVAGD